MQEFSEYVMIALLGSIDDAKNWHSNANKISAFLLHNLILFLYQLILQAGVYEGAVHLEELNVLLARRYALIWPSWTRPIKQISYFNKEISSFSSFA